MTTSGGEPAQHAAVTAESDSSIGVFRSTFTSNDGHFAFNFLPPGEYLVRAEIVGYSSAEVVTRVALEGESKVIFRLRPRRFSGELQVTGFAPVLDASDMGTGLEFDRSFLDNAVIDGGRNFLAILGKVGGVTSGVSSEWLGCWEKRLTTDDPVVLGSTIGENAFYIDGLNTTDPVTGTSGADLPYDAIQEIRFRLAGFGVDHGFATGGVANLVTKSGGNNFSGSADLRYFDNAFLTDGVYFDADAHEQSSLTVEATLGGPLIRDTAWFFAAYASRSEKMTPHDSPTTSSLGATHILGKLTWQIGPSWRLIGVYGADPTSTDNFNASPFVSVQATGHREIGGWRASAELNSFLTKSFLWTARLGYHESAFDTYPQSGDLETIGRINLETGERSVNFTGLEYSRRERGYLSTDLTWHASGSSGSHEIKGGLESSRPKSRNAICSTGSTNGIACSALAEGLWFEDIGSAETPVPFGMVSTTSFGMVKDRGRTLSAYGQDTWRPHAKLTVHVGLRHDNVRYWNDSGDEIAELSKTQPRLGVGWDLTGGSKTILRASWGLFLHPNNLSLPSFTENYSVQERWLSCSRRASSADECQGFADLLNGWWRTDPLDYDPFGWLLLPENVFGALDNAVSADLRPTYARELVLTIEHEFTHQTAAGLTYVSKRTRDIFEDTCAGNVPTPVERADCSSYHVLNIAGLKREYNGMILTLESRGLPWLSLFGSYAYSSSTGNIEYTQSRAYDFDIYPWHYENRYGYLTDHRKHRVKLNGHAFLPHQFSVGFGASWSSSYRWQPVVYWQPGMPFGSLFVEARGSREGDSWSQIDLQVVKRFPLGPVRVSVIGSVFNVLDSESIEAVCTHYYGCGSVALGEPIGWQFPRRYEVGLRLEF